MENNYTITSTHRYSDTDGERIIFTVQLNHPNAFVDVMYKVDTGLLYIMDTEAGSQVYNSVGESVPNAYFEQEAVMSLVVVEASKIASSPKPYPSDKYSIVKKKKCGLIEYYTVQVGKDAFVRVQRTTRPDDTHVYANLLDGQKVQNKDGIPVLMNFNEAKVLDLVQTRYAVISVYTGYSHGFGMPQVEYFEDEEKAVERLKERFNQALDNQFAYDEEEDIPLCHEVSHSEDWHAAKLWFPTENRDIEDDYFSVWIVPVRN